MPHATPPTQYGPSANATDGPRSAKPDRPDAERARQTTPTPPTRHRRPRAQRDVGTAWLVLLGLLLLAAAPLLIDLSRPGLFSLDEERAVGTAIETWQRRADFKAADERLDPWVPIYLGQLRYSQPPGACWLHVVAITVSHDSPNTPEALSDLRWSSVVMALILVASVFFAGHNIGGLLTAVLSALVAMTLPLLMFFGRIAVPDVPTAAWAALAMAAALWAMRPLRRNPHLARQFLGWLTCGVAFGCAALTSGPAALPVVILPVVAIAAMCPHRVGHALGLVAAIAVAALLVTPWTIYVHEASPDGWQHWLAGMMPATTGGGFQDYAAAVLWRFFALIAFAGVWSIWLIPAISQPFSSSSGQARRRMLLGWAWWVGAALLVVLLPGSARAGALVVMVAPTALLVGQLMRQLHDLSAEGRNAHVWVAGKWVTIVFTAALSLILPLYAWFEPDLPAAVSGLSADGPMLFAKMHAGYWLGTAAMLGLIAALGTRFALNNHPGRAAAAWAAWSLAAATVLAVPLARGPALNTPATAPLPALSEHEA